MVFMSSEHTVFVMILYYLLFRVLWCIHKNNMKGPSDILQYLLKVFFMLNMIIWY